MYKDNSIIITSKLTLIIFICSILLTSSRFVTLLFFLLFLLYFAIISLFYNATIIAHLLEILSHLLKKITIHLHRSLFNIYFDNNSQTKSLISLGLSIFNPSINLASAYNTLAYLSNSFGL